MPEVNLTEAAVHARERGLKSIAGPGRSSHFTPTRTGLQPAALRRTSEVAPLGIHCVWSPVVALGVGSKADAAVWVRGPRRDGQSLKF